jgi:RNase P/RNase MRP subunit p30
MFTLVKFNENYEENIKLVLKEKQKPITLFEINFNDKKQISQDVIDLGKKKDEIKPLFSAVLVVLSNFDNSFIHQINLLKNKFDIVIGQGGLNKINRFFVENTKVDFILNPHTSKFKKKYDFIHHFNSGLNQVLVKIAKDKNIKFIVSLNFTKKQDFNFLKNIGRINQNLMIFRKKKVSCYIGFIVNEIFDVKLKDELSRIIKLFSLSQTQVDENSIILEKRINENLFKKSENYICDDIKLKI